MIHTPDDPSHTPLPPREPGHQAQVDVTDLLMQAAILAARHGIPADTLRQQLETALQVTARKDPAPDIPF